MPGPWYRPLIVAAAALTLAAMPSDLSAQELDGEQHAAGAVAAPGPETEIGLTIGALTPLSNMGQTEDGASVSLSTSFSVGVGVTRWLDDRWGIAVDGLWATGGPDLRTASGEEGGSEEGPADGSATYLTGTASVVHRFSAFAGIVEPRIGLGAGIRHVELDEAAPFGAVSETGPAAVLSAGVRSSLNPRTALSVELRDVISSTDVEGSTGGSALQNDLLVLVGVSFSP